VRARGLARQARARKEVTITFVGLQFKQVAIENRVGPSGPFFRVRYSSGSNGSRIKGSHDARRGDKVNSHGYAEISQQRIACKALKNQASPP